MRLASISGIVIENALLNWAKGILRRRRRRRRQTKRPWKSEFASFQSSSRLLPVSNFVRCRRTLRKLNSWEPYHNSERERKFRRRLCTSSVQPEIRHFHVVVVQWRQRNVQKKRDAREKWLFWLLNPLFLWRSRCGHRRRILRSLIGILRRRRQREGLTHNTFYKQNNNSSRREVIEFWVDVKTAPTKW